MAMEYEGKIYRNLQEQVGYLTRYLETSALANEMGIKVLGRVDTAADLPVNDPDDPFEYGDAYMVGEEGQTPYRMYVWTRDNGSGNPGWFDIGYFPTAPDEFSIVEVNGSPVHIFNADTKLDKNTSVTTSTWVYVKFADGDQGFLPITGSAQTGTIPLYLTDGKLPVGAPTADDHAANKEYVDDGFIPKTTTPSTYKRIYGINADGTQALFEVKDEVNGIVGRVGQGQINSPAPTNDSQLVNRGYANSTYNKKRYLHTVEVGITATNNWSYTIQLLIVSASDTAFTTLEEIRTAKIIGIKGLPGYDTQPADFFGTACLGTDEGYPDSTLGPSVMFIHADGTMQYFSGLSTSAPEVSAISFVDTVTDF